MLQQSGWPEFENFGFQSNTVKQVVNAFASDGRGTNNTYVTAQSSGKILFAQMTQTLSGSAPSRSILFMATIMATPAALAWLGFDGLHHAVISSDNDNGNIGDFAPRARIS